MQYTCIFIAFTSYFVDWLYKNSERKEKECWADLPRISQYKERSPPPPLRSIPSRFSPFPFSSSWNIALASEFPWAHYSGWLWWIVVYAFWTESTTHNNCHAPFSLRLFSFHLPLRQKNNTCVFFITKFGYKKLGIVHTQCVYTFHT